MFRYSGEKIPMSDSDSDVELFGHALAGEAGNGRPQLTIVSRLAGRPTVEIWMCLGGANYIIAYGWRRTCIGGERHGGR